MIDTTETAFQAALEEDPTSSATRLVFADWLEEQGDPRAAGYRWMGNNGKYPKEATSLLFIGESWDWWRESAYAIGPSVLPAAVFDKLRGGQTRSASDYREYPTRRAAEEALCAALILEEIPV